MLVQRCIFSALLPQTIQQSRQGTDSIPTGGRHLQRIMSRCHDLGSMHFTVCNAHNGDDDSLGEPTEEEGHTIQELHACRPISSHPPINREGYGTNQREAPAARPMACLARRISNQTSAPGFLVLCISYNAREFPPCLWSKVSPNASDHKSVSAFEDIYELSHLEHLRSKGASRQVSSQGQPTLGPISTFGAPRGSNTRQAGLAATQKDDLASKPQHCVYFATLTSHVNS